MIRNRFYLSLLCLGLAALPTLAAAQALSDTATAPLESAASQQSPATATTLVEQPERAQPAPVVAERPVPAESASVPGEAVTAEAAPAQASSETASVAEGETSVVITRKNATPGQAVPATGGTTLFSVMMALVAVVLMIFVTAWLIKRFTGLSPINNRQIKVVASLPVGARERLVLVEVGGQQMLLGVTPQQINTLHTFKEPVVQPDKPGQMDFAQRLQAMLSKGPTE